MSVPDYVQAFRDLLGGAGVVDDPQRLVPYITDQRQLFTGSTRAVLKPATTEQVADVVRLAAGSHRRRSRCWCGSRLSNARRDPRLP
jgi:hypothetical protein